MKQHTQKFIQRRKFIMVLPLLVVPFLTMIFWALGGGRGLPAEANAKEKEGLNLALPNAQFNEDEKAWDKLSLYQRAQRDSIRYNEAKRNDPYFRLQTMKVDQDTNKANAINSSLGKRSEFLDPDEEKIHKKLREISEEINKPAIEPGNKKNLPIENKPASNFDNDVDRLESMMELMQSGDEEDAEMKEVNDVLNKILDIQHPERVQQKFKEQSEKNKENAFAIESKSDDGIRYFGKSQPKISIDSSFLKRIYSIESNGFYGLEGSVASEESSNSIEAVVHDQQTLIAGSMIKLSLGKDIYVNGVLIPKDHFVYGVCSLNGERLSIAINSIRYHDSIFPVDLSVYDLDGLEGIYVPGAIARDVAKQSSNDVLQELQLNSLDPSIGTQAATAGIEAAKGLLSKKSKMIRVTVKSGHRVLLKDNKTNKS